MSILGKYEPIVGDGVIRKLRQLAGFLKGATVLHINSTKVGGGVAEILAWMIPMMQIDRYWCRSHASTSSKTQ